MDVIKNRTTEDDSGGDQAPVRLPAGMVEDAIVTEVRRILQTPEVVTQVLAALNVSTHVGRVTRSELEQRFLPILLAASRDIIAKQ